MLTTKYQWNFSRNHPSRRSCLRRGCGRRDIGNRQRRKIRSNIEANEDLRRGIGGHSSGKRCSRRWQIPGKKSLTGKEFLYSKTVFKKLRPWKSSSGDPRRWHDQEEAKFTISCCRLWQTVAGAGSLRRPGRVGTVPESQRWQWDRGHHENQQLHAGSRGHCSRRLLGSNCPNWHCRYRVSVILFFPDNTLYLLPKTEKTMSFFCFRYEVWKTQPSEFEAVKEEVNSGYYYIEAAQDTTYAPDRLGSDHTAIISAYPMFVGFLLCKSIMVDYPDYGTIFFPMEPPPPFCAVWEVRRPGTICTGSSVLFDRVRPGKHHFFLIEIRNNKAHPCLIRNQCRN